ncbi:hypothetical protein KI809_17530 [Geobacter pelophilus]|uniref:Uncharacterized protein n=1 Tax=Geoanaerobacter pelophilus TaxID=60036 RepID=A0AAW4L994_9BACT|nr:hypothetical protein [Geoanaerobacter pelophilus]MBT0666117.1 hypothetical protein [Geoanaerobacter pelophilus]
MKILATLVVLGLVLGMSWPASASDKKAVPIKIASAIDLVSLLGKGASESDIARSLASQKGYELDVAAPKGVTAAQLIDYLMNYRETGSNGSDTGGAAQHKFNADKAGVNGEYGRAVHEYSLALEHQESYETFKSRGDAYQKYLLSQEFPRFAGYTGAATRRVPALAKTILCDAIAADYAKAAAISDNALQSLNSELEMLKFNMSNEKTIFRVNSDVKPYYGKSAQKTLDMMQYRQLSQLQRNAYLQKTELNKSLSDSMAICKSVDYVAHRNSIKSTLERGRNSKWVKYGETGDASYFYDKTNVKPRKGLVSVSIRRERNSNNYQYDLAVAKLNCKKQYLEEIARAGYEDIAGIIVKSGSTVAERDLAGPANVTDQLTRKLCK